MSAQPTLRYLSRSDVLASLPPLDEQLELARETMTALGTSAELPPKVGVHPRATGAFADAMPALLLGVNEDGSGDRMGMKWVAGVPTNNALGLPAISAIVVVNDAQTGIPAAVMNGGPITAARTAAISGVAIEATGRSDMRRAAIIGAGTQGHSHIPILGHVVPGVKIDVFDRHPDRALRLVELAQQTDGIARANVAASAKDAIASADLVVTCASFTSPESRQVMTSGWLRDAALVVAVDYDTICSADVAREAGTFLVDEIGQFQAQRAGGNFTGYPDPTGTIGQALRASIPVQAGLALISHLGVGLADVVFANAILARARDLGLGVPLEL
jgi:alanine dehydrogenase